MFSLNAFLFALLATMDLSQKVNQEVRVNGSVSQEPGQHITGAHPGMFSYYFDLEDGSQTVIYAPPEFDCLEQAQITGTVVAASGVGKGSPPGDAFTEYHIVVNSWKCLDDPAVKKELDRLADSGVGRDEKGAVEEGLVRMGKRAIPTLIQHLEDPRTCWTEHVAANEGEMMNRPANAQPVAPEWRDLPVTLGERCDWILLQIITPQYQSPYQENFKPFSIGRNAWMFRVEDWRAWWAAARYRSLDSIHRQMEKVIDAYWQSHGTEQVVR